MTSQERAPTSARLPKRKLDILIPCFNRPRYLHRILETGLELAIPGAYFVVFDDASDAPEDVPGLGMATTEAVCRSFGDDHVIHIRNPTNMGVAKSLTRYYAEFCDAEYTSLLNPKDEFINAAPIVGALAKLDDDPKLSFVVYPLRQVDRSASRPAASLPIQPDERARIRGRPCQGSDAAALQRLRHPARRSAAKMRHPARS